MRQILWNRLIELLVGSIVIYDGHLVRVSEYLVMMTLDFILK